MALSSWLTRRRCTKRHLAYWMSSSPSSQYFSPISRNLQSPQYSARKKTAGDRALSRYPQGSLPAPKFAGRRQSSERKPSRAERSCGSPASPIGSRRPPAPGHGRVSLGRSCANLAAALPRSGRGRVVLGPSGVKRGVVQPQQERAVHSVGEPSHNRWCRCSSRRAGCAARQTYDTE